MTRRQWIIDGVLAGVVTIFVAIVTARWLDDFSGVDRQVDGLAVGMVTIAGLALSGRRKAPLVVLGVVTVLVSTYLVLEYPYGPVFLPFLVAVYTAASRLPMRTSALATAAAILVLLTHLFTNDAALAGWLGIVPASAWAIVPYAVGTTVRVSREAAERARADAMRERLNDERLRMAEEVHDVVGHGLAAIQMQADIALHVAGREPNQARVALERISATSADAFEELRSTLHLIRRDAATPRDAGPGMDRLDELCDRLRQAGVAVELEVTGRRRALPPPVDLAAYRVLQEALTNVIRHARPRGATIEVHYGDDVLRLTVTNPAAAAPSGKGGLGISGMRRRVESLGGRFAAGTTAGGFEVRAELPLGETK